jgi:hypothetical protein
VKEREVALVAKPALRAQPARDRGSAPPGAMSA